MKIEDQNARLKALDPANSFIVQAPAGSGKTELLIQRYLVLLNHVKQPEEVLAITFTRKAAAEMRQRVLFALQDAAENPEPHTEHASRTWKIAKTVLENDTSHEWDLLRNPNRLRIQTIDSFCASITQQMPITSQFGSQPSILEDPTVAYQQAIDAMLETVEDDVPWANALTKLLLHLDNNIAVVERLFTEMLAKRDQWLPHVVGHHNTDQLRKHLENSLHHVVEENLQNAFDQLHSTTSFCAKAENPEESGSVRERGTMSENINELISLVSHAASMLDGAESESRLKHCFGMTALPSRQANDLVKWQGIAELLLTKSHQWRKAVTKTQGFPAPSSSLSTEEKQYYKSMKERMKAFLETLKENEALRQSLQNVLESPSPQYTESQWDMVLALIEILPILAAQLTLIFQKQGQVDFTEISLAALRALSTDNLPTELALKLDYRIRHMLLDEFQDTSHAQFRLLEQLTAGWENTDGRTLFLVGDPMQSIYRFREAEVGLFLKAKYEGIGDVTLEPLTLTVNFRSDKGVIDWINKTFAQIMPTTENISSGAITFTPSLTINNVTNSDAVTMQLLENSDPLLEANQLVRIIQAQQQADSNATMAVLVRSRSHLLHILPALRAANIHYQALDLESLQQSALIQDLLALTKALLHPADRIAWLSILRAPWCGLNLADMHALAATTHDVPLWKNIIDCEQLTELSPDAQCRLKPFRSILSHALKRRRRLSLRQWVEETWLALEGPAHLTQPSECEDADVFFQLLDALEDGGDIPDITQLEERLVNLYSNSDRHAKCNLQIMTIHKSKGLEFDTVILPSLDRKSPSDGSPLLMWSERTRAHGNPELILAPIRSVYDKTDSLYDYLRREEKKKTDHESGRLLYVAATRTKQHLHLLASVESDQEGTKNPMSGSFLEKLWPLSSEGFVKTEAPCESKALPHGRASLSALAANHNERRDREGALCDWHESSFDITELKPKRPQKLLRRMVTPTNMKNTFNLVMPNEENNLFELNYVDPTSKILGIMIHEALQSISNTASPQTKNQWKQQLLANGITRNIDEHIQTISSAITKTLNDPRGQWILDHKHESAHSEFPITHCRDNKIHHVIIDRTFIDEKGHRWIIDYKTSTPTSQDLETFLNQEQAKYHEQLEHYAEAMQGIEKRTTHLALYFPAISGWREWLFDAIMEPA